MRKVVYIIFVLAFLCAGCSNAKKEEPAPPQNNTLKEHKPRQLRDPFRPDHPTREQRNAEKEKALSQQMVDF